MSLTLIIMKGKDKGEGEIGLLLRQLIQALQRRQRKWQRKTVVFTLTDVSLYHNYKTNRLIKIRWDKIWGQRSKDILNLICTFLLSSSFS